MKKLIVLHCTCTRDDRPLTPDDIMNLFSENRNQDPMPFHYIIALDGLVLKTKKDKELCGHCGKWSKGSVSIAIMGGVSSADDRSCNTMNEKQETALVFLLQEYHKRFGDIEVHGCNELLHPHDSPELHEPFFNVSDWLSQKIKVYRSFCRLIFSTLLL